MGKHTVFDGSHRGATTMSRICLLPLCGLLIVLAAARAGEAPPFKMSTDEAKLLDLINRERQQEKLPPLRPNPLLFKVARAHSANMATQEKQQHDLDDKTPFDRLRAAGYQYRTAAENIASGDVPLPAVVEAWMNSKGHRANILGADYTETGIGLARGEDGKTYYTQVFGKPRAEK
jgi:uncharacterized protein YkwD